MDQRNEQQNANHNYVDDDVRLLELAKKGLFLIQKAESKRKASTVGFRVFELNMEAWNTDCYIPPTL
jgi:hypothetical protein